MDWLDYLHYLIELDIDCTEKKKKLAFQSTELDVESRHSGSGLSGPVVYPLSGISLIRHIFSVPFWFQF